MLSGGSAKNIAYHIKINLRVFSNQAGKWGFRIASDYSYGGAIHVDGIELASRWKPMNWNGTFTDPTQYLTGTVRLKTGFRVIDVYGFGDCCDRAASLQFTAPGASSLWVPVTKAKVNTCK